MLLRINCSCLTYFFCSHVMAKKLVFAL
ncbi:MAG: SWIM zinc finger family protein [Spirochaetales bacterium]|nr:SWIM zinc finger family protein [Spirochaetales bacterium]